MSTHAGLELLIRSLILAQLSAVFPHTIRPSLLFPMSRSPLLLFIVSSLRH